MKERKKKERKNDKKKERKKEEKQTMTIMGRLRIIRSPFEKRQKKEKAT